MSAPSPRAQDIVALLRHVPDPLLTATSLAARESDPAASRDIVEAAVAAFKQRLNTRTLQALTRYATAAAKHAQVRELAERLLATHTMAGQWTAAALLETLGDHATAAAALERMEDASWGEERALRLAALARNRQRAGRVDEAWTPLRQAASAAETKQTLAAIGQLISDGERTRPAPARASRRIAIVGTGTLPLWTDALGPTLFAAGVRAEIFTGDFNQYQQEILDPGSALAAFRPEIVVLAVDHRALGVADLSSDRSAVVDAAIERFRPLWRTCQERFGAAVVQGNFEVPELDPFGALSGLLPGGRARVIQEINLRLADAARDAHVAVFDLNEAAALFGKRRWNDTSMWIAAKQYPAAEAVPFMARRLAAHIRAVCGLTSKCVVLDLDNTLWGGIIGEDGLAGIRLGGDAEGEAYTAFHRYLLGLKRRGIPLAVCSKNNEADALSVFREHPESVLRESDFAVLLANWEPKPDNLRRVATMLNIGLDSLVFVDDNPMERNFIRKELPEVEVPELPDDPALYAEALHRAQLFDALTFTDEDLHRAESYRQNAERATLAAGTADVGDYLASLGMKIELRPFDEANLPRIVQLINKTNQFNLTTKRTTAGEVEGWMRDPSCYTQFMRLTDRFGDSGLTGVMVAFREADAMRIETWLMSCRVLGRRIEDAMLASVCAFARAAGVRAVLGEYKATAKNAQVKDLYPRFGFETRQEGADGSLYELPIERFPKPPDGLFEIDDATAPTPVATGDAAR
jgi:FkbH-like protein